jgi:hypothetical protein
LIKDFFRDQFTTSCKKKYFWKIFLFSVCPFGIMRMGGWEVERMGGWEAGRMGGREVGRLRGWEIEFKIKKYPIW